MAIKYLRSPYKHSYHIANGLYQSYWYGKLLNVLMISGHKQIIFRELEKAFIFFKLKNYHTPLDYYLESLEIVKPVFNVGTVIIRGKKKEFPVFLERSKQCRLVVRWFGKLIKLRPERRLNQRIYNEFQEIHSSKRHSLVKRRDNLFEAAIVNKHNLRFSF